MIVPLQTPFSAIPVAGVFSPDMVGFFMKTDAGSAINLATAVAAGGYQPTSTYNYFPNATLTLG